MVPIIPIVYSLLTTGRMTWQESYDFAISQNSRLPILSEVRAIIALNGGLPLIPVNMWIPSGDLLNKDWV